MFSFLNKTYSQENYIQGYIIKEKGDTIIGFIDYRNWDSNPNKINFKSELESEPYKYTPNQIKEFGVKDELYVSGIVNAEISSKNSSQLDEDPTLKIRKDTTFLQTLFRGTKSLYYYRNPISGDNFYINLDTHFELLIYKKYLRRIKGSKIITENNKYIGQLILYLEDCPSIQSKIQHSSYNKNSLVKIFENYYKASNSQIEFHRQKEKVKTDIGVIVGLSQTTLKFNTTKLDYLSNTDFNPSTDFSAGLYFDIILPRDQGKWSIYNEVLFTSYEISGEYLDYEHENKYTITSTEMAYSYLNLNNLVRFKYPIKGSFIFINGGISNGFAIYEQNLRKIESKFYVNNRYSEEKAIDTTKKYEFGVIIGTGLKYKKFGIEIRYEMGNGISNDPDVDTLTKSFSVYLGYRF